MDLTETEQQTLQDAIAALQATDGLRHVKVTAEAPNIRQHDVLLTIKLDGRTQKFVAEIKAIDRKLAVAQIAEQLNVLTKLHYPGYKPLLITNYVTEQMAEECRRLDLPYLDTVGNLYLPTEAYFMQVLGKPRPTRPDRDKFRANHAAGLKTIFALLCEPNLAKAPYRQIAKFANVALGAIGPILDDLIQRDYLRDAKATGRRLHRKEDLLKEWVTLYPANLRPTLAPRRYKADRELLLRAKLEPIGAYWGGEYGAEKLAHYLKAEEFLLYAPTTQPTQLMTEARLRADPMGNTEILQMFWNPEIKTELAGVAPTLLVYADLMGTAETRNIEAAQHIYERFLKTTVGEP